MSYHRGVARDEYGNSISGASVTVYDAGTTTASTIYSEDSLTTAEDNPFETGADGVYEFWADPGPYDIQIAKAGFSTTTIDYVQLGHVIGAVEDTTASGAVAATGTNQVLDNTFGNLVLGEIFMNGWSLDSADKLQYDGEPTAWFKIEVQCTFEFSAATEWQVQIYRTGSATTTLATNHSATTTTTETDSILASGLVEMVTGDKIQVNVAAASTNFASVEIKFYAIGMS